MFSICHCWSKIPPERGGWTKWSDKWNVMQKTTMAGNTKWSQFWIIRSLQKSQNQVIY